MITGMHLSDRFGRTEHEVAASGIPIAHRIPVPVDDDSGRGMGVSAGMVTAGMAEYFADNACDAMMLLGDRGEMLAGATAALFARIPTVHIAGGDRSGSVDDSIRHAVSKLSHVHCVSGADSAQRLIGLGEDPGHIHDVGAPGLAGLQALSTVSLTHLAETYGFDPDEPYAVLLFHPVVQDADDAGKQWSAIFAALARFEMQTVCLLPNADHGTDAIRSAIMRQNNRGNQAGSFTVVDHMPRTHFLSAVRHAAMLIGNSSSGIVEAASLETAVVNVGDRQQNRLRSANVFDTPCNTASVTQAIELAQKFDAIGVANAYGTTHADRDIRRVLEETDFSDPALLKKAMPY